MIADGDKLAVGLSGGKDSLALVWILKNRLKHIPVDYELTDCAQRGKQGKPLFFMFKAQEKAAF